MSGIDIETKRKLREMGAAPLLEALEAQDQTLVLGLSFEDRVRLVVDEAHSTFNHTKVEGLIRRAGLRYPNADLRRIDLVEERGLDRNVIAALGTCGFIDRQQNVVFQGFTGSGKSYLGCAVAKQACQHRIRAQPQGRSRPSHPGHPSRPPASSASTTETSCSTVNISARPPRVRAARRAAPTSHAGLLA